MSKRDKFFLFLFGLITILYIGYQVTAPEPTDWSDSYSRDDTIPYGTYILNEELSQVFPERDIHELIIPPFEYLRNPGFDKSERRNWIFINNEINPDPLELELLMGAVSRGDDLFISASAPGQALADTLGFDVAYRTALGTSDSLETLLDTTRFDTQLNFENPQLQRDANWEYEERLSAYFTRVDTANTARLGYTDGRRLNFIRIGHGDGNIYIHLFPRAFTNYYVRDFQHANYVFRALSYLPVRNVVWDEYYKAGRSGYTTPMGYVLSQPPLRKAWFLTLTGVVLFMIFKGRRVQRAIPERHPPKNSTLEFARTIGSLYLEKGTHKEIAIKKIRFFTDYCRRNLGINIIEIEDDPAGAIAERSGIPEPEIKEMMDIILNMKKKPEISKQDLQDVTSKIDQFYKKSLR
ncbi:DUF4350 domain-containing protein [Rhodohalobacter sp. 8-1]|uniref:DUF4350 domain-containing protein n=1 Tax=Rhodohalobacter sp. 8-1 TaxID=3131972 RepID=UPI0030ECD748